MTMQAMQFFGGDYEKLYKMFEKLQKQKEAIETFDFSTNRNTFKSKYVNDFERYNLIYAKPGGKKWAQQYINI